MSFSIRSVLYAPVLLAVGVVPCHASPLNFTLLPLVPPGAQIVAGFENYFDSNRHGILLLSSHYDRLDFADWQSITGVDSKRSLHEVIEVAGATPQGELTEHLLLVAGRFDRELIFKSAQMNSAGKVEFEGHPVILIKPFAREKGDMVDTRWMAILENRIGLLGSRAMVQQALRRFANHADTDMILRERLSQLRRDVTSWNVLVAARVKGRQFLLHPGSAWAPLLDRAEMLTVGVRFGSKVRVDFSVHTSSGEGADFLAEKANSFRAIFAGELPADSREGRLRDLIIETGHVLGSIQMSSSQFDEWSLNPDRPRTAQTPLSRGE